MDRGQVTLARRLRALTARRTGLAVCLWGEPGIGKTHAAQALLRETPCRGLSLPARAPLADLARALPRPARLPAWAGRVLERLQNGEAVDGAGAVDALGAALAGLAPFVLHLEDLHESGAEPLERTSALARLVVCTRGVGLLVTSRAPSPEGLEALRLRPLDRAASDALLEAASGAPLPPGALAWLFGRAAGNPLFTLEYFRLLARQGHLWNDGQRWRWRAPAGELMPVTVEALIERALQEAAPSRELREVVSAQALLPPGADRALLAAVTGLSPAALEATQAELERRGVLSLGHFAHPLYREVGLRSLDADGRRAVARRALEALRHDPEQAAAFVEAADLPPADALTVLEGAAWAAFSAGRTAQAARLWARATGHAGGDEQARLALQAARALETIDPPEALRLARLAADLRPGDPDAALYLAGRLVQRSRRLADADEVLAGLPEAVRSGPAWTAWQVSFLMGGGQYREALDLWTAHLNLHDELNPALLYSVAVCLVQTGQLAGAAELAARGLTLTQMTPTQRASLLNVSSMICAFQGEPDAAAAHLDEALSLARAHGLSQMLGALLQNRAKNLERTEHFAEALAAAQESWQAYGEAGDSLRHANAGVLVAGHLLEFGRHDEAETILLDSLGVLERQEPSRFLVVAQVTLVGLYLDWQPPHGAVLALKLARSALDHVRRLGPAAGVTAFALASLARAEAWAGDAGAALAHAGEAVDLARQAPDESTFLAPAALAAAHAAHGQSQQARAALAEALAAAKAGNFVLDSRRLALEAARLSDDVRAAREVCAWFAARGLMNGVRLARRAFPELASEPDPSVRDVSAASHAFPTLCLEVLGPLRCGPPGQTVPVRGRKRRELLAALLEARLRGRQELARTGLLDLLYPGADDLQAAASLRELVHQTRLTLGPGVIQTTPAGYALGEVGSDAAAFLEEGDTRLWRGTYLQDAAFEGDGTISDALHLALRARVEAALETDPPEAARAARLLLEADPYDLGALRLTLHALRAAGNHRSLTRAYADARARLNEVGEPLPERWTDFLTPQPA